MNWLIESIGDTHQLSGFQSGQPSLDQFLNRYALLNEKSGHSRTFVLVEDGDKLVRGYYSLSATMIERDELPKSLSKRWPRYPAPAALLARLAVDQSLHGQGLGKRLLTDALERCVATADEIGMCVVLVDAIDDQAATFYRKYGFVALQDEPNRLYIPLQTIRSSMTGS